MSPEKQTILMVSKPISPPWTDSSKNLVRDLVLHGERFQYRVLTTRGQRLGGAQVTSEPIYNDAGRYTPALVQNIRVMGRLLARDTTALTHFFFAPNPRTCQAARLSLRLRPRKTLQTVCSIPLSFEQPEQLLFADRVVVLSRHTRDQFIAQGVLPRRLVRIPPGIRLPAFPSSERRLAAKRNLGLPEDRPVIIFPGDLQFSRAARTVAQAVPLMRDLSPMVIFACRPKQEASLLEERRLRSELAHAGVASLVRHLGEVPDMLELLRACDLCLLPAESLYAKMDYPLVLLEALALGVPMVVADVPPLSELLDDPVGLAVPPGQPAALAQACRTLLESSPEARDALIHRCREVACQRHDIAAVSRRHEQMYQDLLVENEDPIHG